MNKLTIQNLSTYNFNVYKFLSVFLVSLVGFYISCSKSPTNTEEPKRPQIVVVGSITENTIWEIGKDYIVRGIVTVEENATLTINKDVNVYFTLDSLGNKGKLYIKGMIYADGEDSRTMINFAPKNEQANGDESWGIDLASEKLVAEFNYCSFRKCFCGIKIVKSDFIINNCYFEGCVQGISISKCDSVCILNSEFLQNISGIKIELSKGNTDSSIIMLRNSFSGNSNKGIEVTNISEAIISDNYFENCNVGIICFWSSDANIIYNNFKNCHNGIKIEWSSIGDIKRNTFSECYNSIYLLIRANPLIRYNNFLECKNYKLYVRQYNSEMKTDAKYNWWGTVRKSDIEISILDAADADSTYGVVDFEPFETSLINDCGVRSNQ